MKLKRWLCGLLSVVFLTGACAAALPASGLAITADKDAKENRAWLADLYIRETTTDFGKHEIVPVSDAYSHTLEEYKSEVEAIKALYSLDLEKLGTAYIELIEKLFNILGSTDLGVSYDTMKSYLETEWKIIYPSTENGVTLTYTTIAYACLKYDLLYPIMGVHFTVPENTTLERTIVLILATFLGEEVDGDVATIRDYAIYSIKKTLIDAGYQISPNADPDELLILYKIVMAEKQGYVIEDQDIAHYTPADLQYVDGAYAASVIKMRYDITPEVNTVIAAMNDSDQDAVAKMILRTMIREKGESVSDSTGINQLFQRACELGYFALDNELYADIYEYKVYLIYNCKEIWLTPFAYAAQLGNEYLQYVKITINGTAVASGESLRFVLSGNTTDVTIDISYDDGNIRDHASYHLTVYNGTETIPDILPDLPLDSGAGGTSDGSGGNGGSPADGNYSGEDDNGYGLLDPEGVILQLYDTNTKLPLSAGGISNGSFDQNASSSNRTSTTSTDSDHSSASNIALPIILTACAVALIVSTTVAILIRRKRKGIIANQ